MMRIRAMNAPLLHCRDLQCMRPLWREGASHVRGVTAEFTAGCFHAIRGSEGCGKNLLLHVLGLLEQPDAGEVWVGEMNARHACDVFVRKHRGGEGVNRVDGGILEADIILELEDDEDRGAAGV